MSKRKSKKSKNTMLIVFLVITFIIAIALLLYFFLWKENYGEIRENMSEKGEGKGYGQKCMDDNYRCKESLTCSDKNEQGKGTCKCKNNETHFSELTDEEKPFFNEGDECIPKQVLTDLGEQGGCEQIFSGVWDGSKCLPSDSKICKSDETPFSQLTDKEKKFFKGNVCISEWKVDTYKNTSYHQQGCESIDGVWYGSKDPEPCKPPGTSKPENPYKDHPCYSLKAKYDECKECCRTHVGAGATDQVHAMSSVGTYNPTFGKCVENACSVN